MSEVQRKVKVTTIQKINSSKPPAEGNLPFRDWKMYITLVGENGEELPAKIFDSVTYQLHPTFANHIRTLKKPPFEISETGWGEFDMQIILHLAEKGGDRKIAHDLNFAKEKYEVIHTINVPTNKPNLLKLLAESGPIPGADELKKKKRDESPGNDKRKYDDTSNNVKKRSKSSGSSIKGSVDLEKLAEGLTKLQEDDLLGVVQMVTDNKTPEMNIKNDVEEGEFHMDLFTLPDGLLRSLWDYVKKRTT